MIRGATFWTLWRTFIDSLGFLQAPYGSVKAPRGLLWILLDRPPVFCDLVCLVRCLRTVEARRRLQKGRLPLARHLFSALILARFLARSGLNFMGALLVKDYQHKACVSAQLECTIA